MFQEKGYQKTAGQCKVKWKHMKASFSEAVKKQDRMLCPIYFDQMYDILKEHLDKQAKIVAQGMLVPGFTPPVCRSKWKKKRNSDLKVAQQTVVKGREGESATSSG